MPAGAGSPLKELLLDDGTDASWRGDEGERRRPPGRREAVGDFGGIKMRSSDLRWVRWGDLPRWNWRGPETSKIRDSTSHSDMPQACQTPH